jgi:DNA-binding transcriptional LysR family regulator
MELRHLRYFVAVAEEKSITVAAKRRLRTAQPSLSRQLRALEIEVGARLMTRSARGIELTAAGKTFLDHARLAWHRSKQRPSPRGARLRFRPVMMTSFAFIFGLLPLVIAEGAGALSRRAVGTPVFGGMIVASLFGIFVIPMLYVVVFQWLRERTARAAILSQVPVGTE